METGKIRRWLKAVLLLASCMTVFICQGCAVIPGPPAKTGGQIPMTIEERPFPRTKPIHAKAGIYLNERLKRYVYREQIGGRPVQINAGEHLATISKQMTSALFRDSVLVDTSPPKAGGYAPDVAAVVEPEIIYFGVSGVDPRIGGDGSLAAGVLLRVTIYDLGGNTLWRNETSGEATIGPTDPSRGKGSSREDLERVGYEALLSAAFRTIHDLNAQAPARLYKALEPVKVRGAKTGPGGSDASLMKAYQKTGKGELERRNHHQALYWFEKAESISPGDGLTRFYSAVCRAYIGQRTVALEQFKRIVAENPDTQVARDSARWVRTVANPLKIGVVVIDRTKDGRKRILSGDNSVYSAIKKSGTHEVVDVTVLKPPLDGKDKKKFSAFLDRCARTDIKLVLYAYTDKLERKAIHKDTPPGDSAMELSTLVSAQVFSVKKKKLHSQVSLRERISLLDKGTGKEEDGIRTELLTRASERLVLKLLARDIL